MFRHSLSISKSLGLNQARLFSKCHRNNAVPLRWGKPDIGRIKLNFDGASKFGSNNASIGGVYRNHEGVFLLGYAERLGKATSSVAELVAAKRGLELALENGWLNIWIEGDAKVVVDVMTKGMKLKSREDAQHAKDISLMISQLKEFNVSHIYRKGNKVADKLAKLGYNMKNPKIWQDVPPKEIIQLLQQDAGSEAVQREMNYERNEPR